MCMYADMIQSDVQSEVFKQSGVAELIAAMAGGWNAKMIVETWSHGGVVTTSAGLAIAASHTCGRHVCIVPDERSKLAYIKAMHDAGVTSAEVIVGEAEDAAATLLEVDFLVVDCRRRDFGKVLMFAKISQRGAVLVRKNVNQRSVSGFKWHGVLHRGTRVVRTVYLPAGKGLDIAHIGSSGGVASSRKGPSRWIRHIDEKSGEEHLIRG